MLEEVITCVRCRKPAKKYDNPVQHINENGRKSIQDCWYCPHGCTHQVPYPKEDTEWPLEFVIVDGQKIIVRPGASEFA